jgi:3-methyladenine DNA glycosylase AlkD
MDVSAVADQVRADLREAADPERAAQQQRYLRSSAEHWGVSVPQARTAIRAAGRSVEHEELIGLVDRLWAGGVFDTRLAAALLLDRHASAFRAADLGWLTGLIREARTWALVDLLVPRPLAAADADDAVGTTAVLDAWSCDEDFWLRRSAILAHLIGLRVGEGDWDRFARYADRLLADRELFVRKAIGWVLRDAGRQDPQRVAAWVAARTDRISGVALREAVKPLDAVTAAALRAAYAEGRVAEVRPAPR